MREIQSPEASGKGQARADDERRYRIRWHRPADPAGEWTEATGYVLSNGRDVAEMPLARAREWAAGFEATSVTRTTCTLEEAADAPKRP